jgi:5-methylcytosine-specific restriction endonuclease McrA
MVRQVEHSSTVPTDFTGHPFPSDFCEICRKQFTREGWGRQSATFGFACSRCVNKSCRLVRRHNRRAKAAEAKGRLYAFHWLSIVYSQDFRCAVCRARTDLTLDHVVPLGKGGQNLPHNVQPLCQSCHGLKDNILPGTRRAGYIGS